jgi:hypothetical protein
MSREDVQNLKPSFAGPVRRKGEFALGQPLAMFAIWRRRQIGKKTLKRLRA